MKRGPSPVSSVAAFWPRELSMISDPLVGELAGIGGVIPPPQKLCGFLSAMKAWNALIGEMLSAVVIGFLVFILFTPVIAWKSPGLILAAEEARSHYSGFGRASLRNSSTSTRLLGGGLGCRSFGGSGAIC